MNEAEGASGYTHKKSTSRSIQNDMNTLNDKECYPLKWRMSKQ